MQKILRFLESSVEWIALVIALAFLGWSAFYYLISDPVSRQMEGHAVSPGTVDSVIDQNAAERLRTKMGDVQVPSFTVEDFTVAIDSQLRMDPYKPSEVASGVFDYSPFDIAKLPGGPNKLGVPVQQLPTMPAARPLLVAAALDTFAPPPAAAGAAPPAAPAAPAVGKDTRLVVAAFTIPWTDLYDQWNKSFGPPKPGGQARLTPADFQILSITAYRSEKIGNVWSKDEQVPAFNSDLPAYPPAGNKNLQEAYLQALAKEPNAAVAPTIPTPMAGVVWKDPLAYLPATSNQPGSPQTPDQNGASFLPHSQQLPVVNASNVLDGTLYAQFGGPPGGFGGPPGGFGGPRAPRAPQQPAEQTPPPPVIVPPAPGTVDPVFAPGNPKMALNPTPIEPVMKLNVVALAAKSPDLCVYIVDNSADAGKTYRYRIVYKALNPLFNKAPQKASNKNWVNQFDLDSPMSDFSPEITVPVQTYFYCGKSQGVTKTAASPFDVFTWSNGKWQKGSFNVNLGDPIGGVDASVDYSTGYSFVDRHMTKSNKILVTVVDREGIAELRDTAKDAGSSDYKEKVAWVEQTKNGGPQAGSNPNQPGGLPPGFGGPPGGFGGPPGGFGGPPGGFGGPPGAFGQPGSRRQ